MKPKGMRTTLLELVLAVQDTCRTDAEVVAVVTHLVNSRRVVLCGNFARMRIGSDSGSAGQAALL